MRVWDSVIREVRGVVTVDIPGGALWRDDLLRKWVYVFPASWVVDEGFRVDPCEVWTVGRIPRRRSLWAGVSGRRWWKLWEPWLGLRRPWVWQIKRLRGYGVVVWVGAVVSDAERSIKFGDIMKGGTGARRLRAWEYGEYATRVRESFTWGAGSKAVPWMGLAMVLLGALLAAMLLDPSILGDTYVEEPVDNTVRIRWGFSTEVEDGGE